MSRLTLIVITAGTIGILASGLTCNGVSRNNGKASSDFSTERFLVILFPRAGESVEVDRAVIVSLKEMDEDKIEVFVNGKLESMKRSLFSPEPDDNASSYVNRLNEKIQRWGNNTDWEKIEYDYVVKGDNARVDLTVEDKTGSIIECRYTIEGSSVSPIEIILESSNAKRLAR